MKKLKRKNKKPSLSERSLNAGTPSVVKARGLVPTMVPATPSSGATPISCVMKMSPYVKCTKNERIANNSVR